MDGASAAPPASVGGEAPTITLGGRAFQVPALALRQTRVIIPAMMELFREGPAVLQTRQLKTEHYELLITIALAAVSRAEPSVTRDTLLDLPITVTELSAAIPVIARQSGMAIEERAATAAAGEQPPAAR